MPKNMDQHDYVCRFITGLARNLPSSVETLELRLSLPFLDRLIGQLLLYERGVKRIGIDLGALVQIYPLRATRGGLTETAVKRAATLAARKARFDIYEAEHGKVLPKDSKWWLAKPSDLCAGNVETSHAKHAFERDFYRFKGGTELSPSESDVDFTTEPTCPFDESNHSSRLVRYLEDTRVDTLTAMLYKLYDMGTSSNRAIEMFSL